MQVCILMLGWYLSRRLHFFFKFTLAILCALEQKKLKFLTLVEPKKKKKKRKKLGVDGELLINKPKGRPKVKQDGNCFILFIILKIRVVDFHAAHLTQCHILIVLDISLIFMKYRMAFKKSTGSFYHLRIHIRFGGNILYLIVTILL